jgi:hypothetical protein
MGKLAQAKDQRPPAHWKTLVQVPLVSAWRTLRLSVLVVLLAEPVVCAEAAEAKADRAQKMAATAKTLMRFIRFT